MTHKGCQEMDMCRFGPCLNGGSCVQDKAEVSCLCKPQFSGQNCEWQLGNNLFSTAISPLLVSSLVAVLILLSEY